MKNLFYALLTLISLSACSQSKNAPQNILKAFNQKFPNAKEVEWGKENENIWEAEFEVSNKDMSANFNLKGEWLETESEIAKKDLPKSIKSVISTAYKGYKIKEIGFTETPKYKAFEVEVKKGNKLVEVVLNGFGKIIKTKTTDEEKDEEEN
jgi:Putative beta-lactamase-inhibitor-like, PepSY-like